MRAKPLRLAVALLGLVGLLVLAAVLYVAFADLGAHKARLEAYVSEQTGKPFSIEGPFEVRVLPTVLVRAERLRLGEQVEVGRFLLEVGTWSLLSGPIEVRALELRDATIFVDATGEDSARPGAGAPGPVPILRSASLSNVRIVVRAPGKPERVALIESLAVAASPAGRLSVNGKGQLDSMPATLEGDLGTLDSLLARRNLQLAVRARLGELSAELKGKVARLDPLEGASLALAASHPEVGELMKSLGRAAQLAGALELQATLEGEQLDAQASVGELTAHAKGPWRTPRLGVVVPNLARVSPALPAIPASLEADYARARDAIELKNLSARLGQSKLAGHAAIGLSGKQRVELELASPSLDLTPFLKGAGDGKRKPAAKYVFSETPLPLEALAGIDARVRLAAAEVKLDAARLQDFAGKLSVEAGGAALEASAKGGVTGTIAASASLQPGAKGSAELRLKVDARELRTGFEASRTIEPKESPATRVDVAIETRGASARQMAAATNGHVVVAQGPGRIRAGLIGLLGGDTLSQLTDKLNPFSATDPYSQLECAVVRAQVVGGQARLEPVLMQTVKVAVAADGEIDLTTEALRIGFNTRPRQGIGLSAGMITNPFVALGGTLAQPKLGVGGTMAAASGAAAIFTGGMSVLAQGLFDRFRGAQDLCADALPAATR